MAALLFRWILSALSLIGVAYLIPGVGVDSFMIALLAAFVLGLVNAVVRPILFILSLPVTILTLGLFMIVINALMLLIAASFVPGFTIAGFVPAILATLVLWIANIVIDSFIHQAQQS